MQSQDYILTSKRLDTGFDENFIKKRSMKLDLSSTTWRRSLKHIPKNEISDSTLGTRDLLSRAIDIQTIRSWAWITRGDGVTVVPNNWKGSQDSAVSKSRTGVAPMAIHSNSLLTTRKPNHKLG